MDRDDKNLFAAWTPAETPPELGDRVLAAARRSDRAARPRRLEDRVWHSRSLRVGWLAAATALLIFNLWLPVPETEESRGLHAADSGTDSPDVSTPTIDSGERPRWSDQQMLLCKVLEDCARATDDARLADEENDGGNA